jgi:hypothetical protein
VGAPVSEFDPIAEGDAGRRFRRTLVRVIAVQVITLALLWLLQTTFTA